MEEVAKAVGGRYCQLQLHRPSPPLPCPPVPALQVAPQLEAYLAKCEHVSTACRLPADTLLTLLTDCDRSKSAALVNQFRLLKGLDARTASAAFPVVYPAALRANPVERLPMFDGIKDTTCFDKKPDFWTQHFSMVSYSRPPVEELQVCGPPGPRGRVAVRGGGCLFLCSAKDGLRSSVAGFGETAAVATQPTAADGGWHSAEGRLTLNRRAVDTQPTGG